MALVKILYFASLGEAVGKSEESIELSEDVNTIQELKTMLSKRGENWQKHFEATSTKCAINEAIATADSLISDGDEIAFFPPVTGG